MLSSQNIQDRIPSDILTSCCALCLLSYGVRENINSTDWNSASIDDLFKIFIQKRPEKKFLLDLPVVKFLTEDGQQNIYLRSYASGLDVLCFVGSSFVIVAADGTDPKSKNPGELIGDMKDGIRLLLGKRPNQLQDLISFYAEIENLCHKRSVFSTGHSLGGHLQGLAFWESEINFKNVIMLNSPGYTRGMIKKLRTSDRANRIICLSAIEPVALIGKHIGQRIWLRSCYSHSLKSVFKYIDSNFEKK